MSENPVANMSVTDIKLQLLEVYRQEEKSRAVMQMLADKKAQLNQIIERMVEFEKSEQAKLESAPKS